MHIAHIIQNSASYILLYTQELQFTYRSMFTGYRGGKHMKKFISILLVSFLLMATFSLPTRVEASEAVKVVVNGEIQNYSQPPIIENLVTLVPMKELFHSLGISDIQWNNKDKTVTVSKENLNLVLNLGSKTATINDEKVELLVPAKIVNDNLLVPLRFVSKTLGADVMWDGSTRTVNILIDNIEPLKIGLITDVSGIHDNSFNQLAWLGLQKAEQELGIKASYIESSQTSDYATNMKQFQTEGNDLLFGIGFTMGDTVLTEAQNNPNQKYAIIDYSYQQTPSNLVGVLFKEEQGSFLAGYIAGKMTETNKVGFVGGFKMPLIDRFSYGFQAGVKYANPDAVVLNEYASSFSDPTKGKEIAKEMYKDGADILFHAAGAVGDGIIVEAKEEDKYVIGVDIDQNYLAPNNVITSVVKRIDNAIYYLTNQLKEDKFAYGKTIVLGLAEGGIDLASTTNKHVPSEIIAEVESIKKKIIDGSITVPYNEETFLSFKMK